MLRLRLCAYLAYGVAIVAVVLSGIGILFGVGWMLAPAGKEAWTFVVVASMVSALVVSSLTLRAAKTLFISFGWMTRDEARFFPFQRGSEWPKAWLKESEDDSSE